MNSSTTVQFNGVTEKDRKDFRAVWIGHRACLLKLFLLSPALHRNLQTNRPALFASHDRFFEGSSLPLLFMLNTNPIVSCWFPSMQVNLMGFLLPLEFTSSVTWMALVPGCISAEILSFQGQWCIAWKWEFYELQKCYSLREKSGFFCVLGLPLKWKQKIILKEKLKTLKILFLANCQNFSCWEETSFLTSFLSKIKVRPSSSPSEEFWKI